jgi:hypothetical protein
VFLRKAAVSSTIQRNTFVLMLHFREGGRYGSNGTPGLSDCQKSELWQRWKAGESLSDIGRALGKHAASIFGVVVI